MFDTFIVNMIRLFVESIFCYCVYNRESRGSRFQKSNIKKLVIFSLIHTGLLMAYRHIFNEYIIYRSVSIFIIFVYFFIENTKYKKFNTKNWNYILLFSIFISLVTECSSGTFYLINRIAWKWLNIYGMKNTNFILKYVYIISFLFLHFCCMYLMNKYRFIKMKDIKNLSVYKFISILFGLSIFTVIYVKYQVYQVSEESYVHILSSIFIFLSPVYLSFYRFISKHSVLKINKENLEKEKYITEWVLYPSNQSNKSNFLVNVGDNSLLFLDRYRYLTSGFAKKLKKISISEDCKGFSETIFAMFLTNMLSSHANFTFKKFEKEIFCRTEDIFNLPEGVVRKNIEKMIEKTWKLESLKTLKKEYYDSSIITATTGYHKNIQPPTVEEFLFNMSRINPITLEELLSHNRISLPESRHASLVSIQGEGVLIVGESGIGKTDTVLALIEEKGNYLIADDVVEIRRLDYNLYGNACKESKDFMQIRDIGLIDVKNTYSCVKDFENINLVVHLVSSKKCKVANENEDLDLISEKQIFTEIMDVPVPYVKINVSYGRNISSIIKVAVKENHQKFLGCASSTAFMERNNMVMDRAKPICVNCEEYWGY